MNTIPNLIPLPVIGFRKACGNLVLMLALVVFSQCSKEKDERNPAVEFIKPSEYQVYNDSDTIVVEAKVLDETQLVSVQIQLTDPSYQVKGKLLNIPVGSNPMKFLAEYPLSGLQLTTGDYYLRITASDGENTKYKYRLIKIQSDPPVLRHILLITGSGPGSFALQQLDSSLQPPQVLHSWTHLYASSAVSVANQQLYIAGKGFGECYAFDLEDNTIDFNLPQIGTPSLDYHEQLLALGDRFYLGLTDGYVKGYNTLGAQHFVATMAAGRKPGLMAGHTGQYLVVAEEQRNGTGRWIAAYFLNSGTLWGEYKLPDGMEITGMASVNADEMLLAGNLNGVGRLLVWNVSANAFSTPWIAASGTIQCLQPLPNGQFLLAHEQSVLCYDPVAETAVVCLSKPSITRLRFDEATGTLFGAHQDTLTAWRWPTMSEAWSFPLTAPLLDFHLSY